MDVYLLDWANFLLRWAHVVVAIAWIGASFYFVFLDASLTKPDDPELRARGVDGELWAVHGGGFYHPQKYLVAPKRLPSHLHWFYWESYATWLTGFGLFTALYLFQARVFLVDPHVFAWSSTGAAVAASLGLLIAFWVAYDLACRVAEKLGAGRALGVVVALLVALDAWAACRLFAGRAAFVLAGASLATAMSANVLVWIIPGQRKAIAQMKAGAPVDPIHGRRGKQRSVHNTYFTLPVLAAMLSNHYAFLHGATGNALVLVVLMAAGALVRHSFVARHRARVTGARVPWEFAGAGVAILVALGAWLAPRPEAPAQVPATLTIAPGATPTATAASVSSRPALAQASAAAPSFSRVHAIVDQRCGICHSGPFANKGVRLDGPDQILARAAQVYQQAVVLKAMPLNNATRITDDERDTLRRWYEAGAAGN